MRRGELKELREITKTLHDDMPMIEDCGCEITDDDSDDVVCEFHRAMVRLFSFVQKSGEK